MDTALEKSAPAGGTMTEGVRRRLESEIRGGQLAPGAVLAVKYVAERFGISRTPAKEALLQLAAAGLVDLQPRRGAIVTRLQPKVVFGMLEVLAVLEAEAARLCARRMTDAQRAELGAIQAQAGRAVEDGEALGYGDANQRLHKLIYEGAGNEFLQRQVLEIRARLSAYRPITFERPGRMKASHAEHGVMVEAIVRGDEPEAHRAMTAHITVGGTAQAELMLQMSATAAPR